jgi:hypothetical protein
MGARAPELSVVTRCMRFQSRDRADDDLSACEHKIGSGRQVVSSLRPSIRTPAEPGPQARRGFGFPRQWKQTMRYQRPRKTTRERRHFPPDGPGLPQRTLAGWRRDQLTTRRASGLVRSSHRDFRVVRDIWATEHRTVPSRFVMELGDAISGILRVPSQAARSPCWKIIRRTTVNFAILGERRSSRLIQVRDRGGGSGAKTINRPAAGGIWSR